MHLYAHEQPILLSLNRRQVVLGFFGPGSLVLGDEAQVQQLRLGRSSVLFTNQNVHVAHRPQARARVYGVGQGDPF